ncbi:MAG: radical SAM protein [Candidatus Thiodiazotropha endolucinida]|nr:radical SAM protein [Candidatus Thiodiazotropha endolucinida]
MKKKPWRLKISVTDRCNFKCVYCKYLFKVNASPIDHDIKFEQSEEDIIKTLEAASKTGITKVHWTGGEPTLFDLPHYFEIAKNMGFKEQGITTNGYRLHKDLDSLIENGLTSANISLDTLNPNKFRKLTKSNHHGDVIKSIKECCARQIKTKMNVVVMKPNYEELPEIVEFASKQNGFLTLKFLELWEFSPIEKYKELHVPAHELIDLAKNVGDFYPIDETTSNPNISYYIYPEFNVKFGVVNLPPSEWRCGGPRCTKLRVYSDGTTCEGRFINNKAVEDRGVLIKDIMLTRANGEYV